MKYLLDTNVLSELRKETRCDQNVANWQATLLPEDCFISCISVMEIRKGILKVRGSDLQFAESLEKWFSTQLLTGFSGRILPVGLEVAEISGGLLSGRTRNVSDALIAATALAHNLILATRNTLDFDDTGVSLVNPWIPENQ